MAHSKTDVLRNKSFVPSLTREEREILYNIFETRGGDGHDEVSAFTGIVSALSSCRLVCQGKVAVTSVNVGAAQSHGGNHVVTLHGIYEGERVMAFFPGATTADALVKFARAVLLDDLQIFARRKIGRGKWTYVPLAVHGWGFFSPE